MIVRFIIKKGKSKTVTNVHPYLDARLLSQRERERERRETEMTTVRTK